MGTYRSIATLSAWIARSHWDRGDRGSLRFFELNIPDFLTSHRSKINVRWQVYNIIHIKYILWNNSTGPYRQAPLDIRNEQYTCYQYDFRDSTNKQADIFFLSLAISALLLWSDLVFLRGVIRIPNYINLLNVWHPYSVSIWLEFLCMSKTKM